MEYTDELCPLCNDNLVVVRFNDGRKMLHCNGFINPDCGYHREISNGKCPKCGSNDIDYGDHFIQSLSENGKFSEPFEYVFYFRCLECNCIGEEIYKLVRDKIVGHN